MSLAIFIQSRLNSSRLPGKALLKLSNSTLLGMITKRCVNTGYPTYVLTSSNSCDDLVQIESLKSGAKEVYRGSLDDVQSRFLELSKKKRYEYIARVTADNPLTLVDNLRQLEVAIKSKSCDYCTINPKTCPYGTNLEVFSSKILELSRLNDISSYNKEHVTPWIKLNANKELINNKFNQSSKNDQLSKYNFSIDTLEDYINLSFLINYCEKKYNYYWHQKDFVFKCFEIILSGEFNYPYSKETSLK